MPVAQQPIYNDLIKIINSLPVQYTAQVFDYVSYLKEKADKQAANECPLCAKYSDPESGALIPNAETIAAIEEGDAMLRGEIPAKWYNSLDDMLKDLDSDDEDEKKVVFHRTGSHSELFG